MTRGILTNKKIRSERKVHSVKSGMFDSTVKVSAHVRWLICIFAGIWIERCYCKHERLEVT